MRAILRVLGISDRSVWLADTFEGIPVAKKCTDIHDVVNDWEDRWTPSIKQVRKTFYRHGMLDKLVKFLQGEFSETLNPPPFGIIAVALLGCRFI